MRLTLAALFLVFVHFAQAGTAASQVSAPRDTTIRMTATDDGVWGFSSSVFDTIHTHDYVARRSFSLDQFFEALPGFVMGRRGPIGAEAAFSRHGMGRGRGIVYLGKVPLNDPQDGRAPLALTPTTSVGRLVLNGSSAHYLPAQSSIEGVVQIIEPKQLGREPMVAIELSQGDRDLKQRRARYSSPRKSVGVDVGYDELGGDGYGFDTRGQIDRPGYGSSTMRMQTAEVRGVFPHGDEYRFSFRQFETTFEGDTISAGFVNRRTGYIALAEASSDRVHIDVFGRSYKVTARDSLTMNQTTSVTTTVPLSRGAKRYMFAGLGYENTFARQEMGGATANDQLQTASASVNGSVRIRENTELAVGFDVAHQFDAAFGWGGRVALARELGSHSRLSVGAKRGYRLPSLGELFLPRHTRGAAGTTEVVGNHRLDSESSFEGYVRFSSRLGVWTNELQWMGARVMDPILPRVVATSPSPVVQPVNSDAAGLQVLQDRFRIRGSYLGFDLNVVGGAALAVGDRSGYFQGVPELRATAAASVGRSLFKNTSDVALAGEYEHGGSRSAGGREVASFDVVNLRLGFRLVDAHLYVLWLNVGNRRYETIAPYSMTPRTFVYGIAWTLYN